MWVQFHSNTEVSFDVLHEKLNHARWNKAGRPAKSSIAKPTIAPPKSPVESCISQSLLLSVVKHSKWQTKKSTDKKFKDTSIMRNQVGSIPFPSTMGIPMLPPSEPSPMSVHNSTTHAFYSNDYLADFDSSDLSDTADRLDENGEKIARKKKRHRRPVIRNVVQYRQGLSLGTIKMELVSQHRDGVSQEQVNKDTISLNLAAGVGLPHPEHSLVENPEDSFQFPADTEEANDRSEASVADATVAVLVRQNQDALEENKDDSDESDQEDQNPNPKSKTNANKCEIDDEENSGLHSKCVLPTSQSSRDRKRLVAKILFEESEKYFERKQYLSTQQFNLQLFYDHCPTLNSSILITSIEQVKKTVWNMLMGSVTWMNDYTLSATRSFAANDIANLMAQVSTSVTQREAGLNWE